MKPSRPCTILRKKYFRSTLLTALVTGGFLHVVMPVLASGTPARTIISNTATASYEDPSGSSYNTQSNVVNITVAEVAGINISQGATPTIVGGGSAAPGKQVEFIFKVTNTSNDPTQFFIPGTVTIPNSNATLNQIAVSANNGTGAYTTVPAAGLLVGAMGGADQINGDDYVLVKVTVTINSTGSNISTGSEVRVLLGNTGSNDSHPGSNNAATQNQADTADGATSTEQAKDVRTVDNPLGSEAATGDTAPANGEREASFYDSVAIADQPQAFASVLKRLTAHSDGSDLTSIQDDTLTYALNLKVHSTGLPTGYSADALAGVTITINGTPSQRILVSDAIPTHTTLSAVPTPPTGWTAIYTADDPATISAYGASWVTDPSTLTGGIAATKRIGFVYTANATLPANDTVLPDLVFTVTATSAVNAAGEEIANMAQLLGISNGSSSVVYDESGDSDYNNYNGSTPPATPTLNNLPTGIADPATHGRDVNNNNGGDTDTSKNAGGEDNVYILTPPGAILNGPNGTPGAQGPTGTNDDFTNRSAPFPTGSTQPASGAIDPGISTFTNTLFTPTDLSKVVLRPFDGTATATVPTNTVVTLSYVDSAVAGSPTYTATYQYDGTDFIRTSTSDIIIPLLKGNTTGLNYTVTVDLPANTPLSTEPTTAGGSDYPYYPVPLYAFVDKDGNNLPDAADPVQNRTINNTYVGFLRLDKDALILDSNGATQLFPASGYTTDFSTFNIQPGQIIQYRITYTNISRDFGGTGNGLLSAANVVITENGATGGNNWASTTLNVVGGTRQTNGTTTSSPGNYATDTLNVNQYINNLGSTLIDPGESGSLIFQRQVNPGS